MSKTKKDLLKLASDFMDKLDFVMWDRYVDAWDEVRVIEVYGWIPREQDSYKDFVLLHFQDASYSYTTSSVKWDDTIAQLLGLGKNTIDCQRLEDLFPDKPNVIKLKK